MNVRAKTTPPPTILITLLSSYFPTLGRGRSRGSGVEVQQETSAPPPKKNPGSAPVGPLEGLTLSTFRGVFLIQFYPLEITQREIIFEIEACECQCKEYLVKTPPTILVLPIFLPSFPH